MSVWQQLRRIRSTFRGILTRRRNRRDVGRLEKKYPAPQAGSIQIAVYFADARVNIYQLRQWYAPLKELAKTWPVVIITRSPSATLSLWEETDIPAVWLRSNNDLDAFVAAHPLRMAFYVNQNARNFQMLRYNRMWHVYINHGESDKVYMTTNQLKAYDIDFIAGDAARERLASHLWAYDIDTRTRSIGRPQADHFAGPTPFTPDDRTVVLYAPTWEGDRAAASYGSVVSHGVALTTAILANPAYRLVYRPHPRSGVYNREYAEANRAIIAAIAAANSADPTAQHVFDDGPRLGWQLVAADVAITDISAMLYDRLSTGKPLIVTRPVATGADIDESGYLGAAEWLYAEDAPNVLTAVETARTHADSQATLNYWVQHTFGDTSPGAATRRFTDAVAELAASWDKQMAAEKASTTVASTEKTKATASKS